MKFNNKEKKIISKSFALNRNLKYFFPDTLSFLVGKFAVKFTKTVTIYLCIHYQKNKKKKEKSALKLYSIMELLAPCVTSLIKILYTTFYLF